MRADVTWGVILATQSEIKHGKGTWFSAIKYKKDGSRRVWNCRLGVSKYLRGGRPAYDAVSKNFITVFCRKAKMYRQINVSTLQYLKVCGKVLVENGKPTLEYTNRESIGRSMIAMQGKDV